MSTAVSTERLGAMGVRLSVTASAVAAGKHVAIIGGGPAGMTAALLLARAGHRVSVFEKEPCLGGLWASRLDGDGYFVGDNSCKVYQSDYHTALALLASIGTHWERHFTARHDFAHEWLRPFLADCSAADLAKLGVAFALHTSGLRSYRDVSVGDFLVSSGVGEPCQAWMRASALGGVTGTLRMTMWEMLHRFRGNFGSIVRGGRAPLFWNAQPPSSRDGFVTLWAAALERLGVEVRGETAVRALGRDGDRITIETDAGERRVADAVFLALPPPALAELFEASAPDVAGSFGLPRERWRALLADSVYEHLGVTWFFDRPLPHDLPLGGHNVRRGWHPILVQHPQYRAYLRPPAVTAVVGSVSVVTDLRHPRLGTRALDHAPDEMARLLWADERAVDSSLPEPIGSTVYGLSTATQLLHHGPMPIRARGLDVFVATHLNGHAPYFTASLESAIQAGSAAAAAFDPRVDRLPVA